MIRGMIRGYYNNGMREYPIIIKRQHIIEGDIVKIPLTKGQIAIVDRADYDSIPLLRGNWCVSNGYAARTVKRRPVWMHHVIMGATWVDHINRNPFDNRRSNLRAATLAENNLNREWKSVPKTSRYRGVSWDKAASKWVAQIKHNGKGKNLGRFDNERDAALAYDKASIEIHGVYGVRNFGKEES